MRRGGFVLSSLTTHRLAYANYFVNTFFPFLDLADQAYKKARLHQEQAPIIAYFLLSPFSAALAAICSATPRNAVLFREPCHF